MTPEHLEVLRLILKDFGLPALVVLFAGLWGYAFFSNPPWGKRRDREE